MFCCWYWFAGQCSIRIATGAARMGHSHQKGAPRGPHSEAPVLEVSWQCDADIGAIWADASALVYAQ